MNSTQASNSGVGIPLNETRKCPFKTGHDPGLGAYGSYQPSPTQSQTIQYNSLPNAQNGNSTSSSLPASVMEYLPTFFHDSKEGSSGKAVIKVEEDIERYITLDLEVKRLNEIHGWLWMCGRPINARALHRNHVLNRRITPTEQADLHLLHYADTILLKPLPAYILSKEVWDQILCKDAELHKNACGLLLSYIWLIRSPLDFKLAIEKDSQLLPAQLSWATWKRIVDESLQYIDPDTLHQCNKRYQFGELRLGRINTIYRMNPRFFLTHFVRGYLYGYNRYAVFFQRNVAWILAASVLFSLVLSAMQVGVAVDPLVDNKNFKLASYGFVVFSIVLVAAVLAFVGLVFVSIFFFNMVAAIKHSNGEQARRARLAKSRLSKSA